MYYSIGCGEMFSDWEKEKVKVDHHSREDNRPLVDSNLVKGCRLLLEKGDDSFPVSIVDIQFKPKAGEYL